MEGTDIAHFQMCSRIDAPARVVFAWHQSPDALRRLIPPGEPVVVEQVPRSLADGEQAVLVIRIGLIRKRWVARHQGFVDRGDDGGEFTDVQVSGPFRSWVHRHIVRATDDTTCELDDRIDYELPFGLLGALLGGWFVRRKLQRMFAYRHAVTQQAVSGRE